MDIRILNEVYMDIRILNEVYMDIRILNEVYMDIRILNEVYMDIRILNEVNMDIRIAFETDSSFVQGDDSELPLEPSVWLFSIQRLKLLMLIFSNRLFQRKDITLITFSTEISPVVLLTSNMSLLVSRK